MKLRGFTLVEVMVALAIVAVALPAMLMALARQMDDTGYMRDKSIAQMVAANKLAEMRLVIGSTRTLQAGNSNGFDTMVERDWYWWVQTQPTPVDRFFRVEINVALDEESQDRPLYQLTAFMNSDLAVDEEGLLGFGGDDSSSGQSSEEDDQSTEESDPTAGDGNPVEIQGIADRLREGIQESE